MNYQQGFVSYEQSVHQLRTDPKWIHKIQDWYLDEDNCEAAQRFAQSIEFHATARLLRLNTATKHRRKIMDLGCGNGIASYAFASRGHEVYAIDPDDSQDVGLGAIERLLPLLASGTVTPVRSYAEDMPFEDATFDIIYTRQAVHHYGNIDKALRECHRVLKPGGFFMAAREHVANDEEQLNLFLAAHPLHKWHGGENAYPLPCYLSSLAQAGFKVIKCLGPYESPINEDPTTYASIKNQLAEKLEARFGVVGQWLSNFQPIEQVYRRRLMRDDNAPGRLYTFVASSVCR